MADMIASNRAKLLAEVEAFLAGSGLSPTAFGRQALGDPGFVRGLRSGRTIRPNTYERIKGFMETYRSQQATDTAPATTQQVILAVEPSLVRDAKELGVDLSEVVSASLTEVVRSERAKRWRAENAKAIATYNERVEEHGVFGDIHRRF